MDADAVAVALGVDPLTGLSSAEAARRLQRDGPNELRAARVEPPWHRLLRQFRDPLIVLLLVAVGIALVAWATEGAHGVPVDAVVIAAVVALNAVLGFAEEERAARAVAALATLTAATSTVVRDGVLRTLPAAELVAGDVLVLAEGDAVGADGRLVTASALRIGEAQLTGESEAVVKDPAALHGPAALADRTDMVFKGTAVVQGVGRAVVTATGMRTQLGEVARLLDRTEQVPTPLQRELKRVGRTLGLVVVAIAVVVMAAVALLNRISTAGEVVTVLLFGVSLAVAAVPEGLPAILSVVLALGVQRMARRGAVVKTLDAVEALGGVTVVCSDKTGTLTRNEMTLRRIVTASGRFEVTGAGYRPEGEVLAGGAEPAGAAAAELDLLLVAGVLANDAELRERDGDWAVEGDPTEAAFLVAARKRPGVAERVVGLGRRAEVPFTSERKRMSVVVDGDRAGDPALLVKGAPDVVLDRCTRLQVGGEIRPLDPAARADALAGIEELAAGGMRAIGVAYRPLPVGVDAGGEAEALEEDLVHLGVVGIVDPPRAEVGGAIAEAQRAGVRVVLITGDHPATAARIAADLGIATPGAPTVSGLELDAMDDLSLRAVARDASVFARVAPEHKLRLIDALHADHQLVAMTGDGVNDAPALKAADIGVAMGSGTEVAKEAARMVLADDDFATIVAAVREGRIIFENVRKTLRYLLSTNLGEVLTVFLGVLLADALGLRPEAGALALPLLATQILWINLVTDAAPALALGVQREVEPVMDRAPRGMREHALDGPAWRWIAGMGLLTAVVTLLAIDLCLPGGLLPGRGGLDVARTAGFTTLVLAQLVNALVVRSPTRSAFRRPFPDRVLVGALALGAALQVAVVSVPFLQVAFRTAPLDAGQWLACLALASSVLWVDELRKAVVRARLRRAGR